MSQIRIFGGRGSPPWWIRGGACAGSDHLSRTTTESRRGRGGAPAPWWICGLGERGSPPWWRGGGPHARSGLPGCATTKSERGQGGALTAIVWSRRRWRKALCQGHVTTATRRTCHKERVEGGREQGRETTHLRESIREEGEHLRPPLLNAREREKWRGETETLTHPT